MSSKPVKVRELQPPRNPEAGTWNWSLRAIDWKAVFAYQNWGGIPTLIPAIVLLILAHYSFEKSPRYVQAYLYDATIAYPYTGDTISYGTAALYPWLAMLVTVFVVEFGLFYQQQSITSAAAATLHVLWSCFVNFIIVLAASEMTKTTTGALRPNFLARCQPDPAQLAQPFSYHEPARCTNPDTNAILQGRLAFVSGHASNTLCVSWFNTLYLVWVLYWRANAPYPTQVFGQTTWLRRVVYECLYSFFYWWMLFCLLLSWFISCTRVWDNEHTIGDIIGGLMLALLLTTPYVFKTFGQYVVFKRELDSYHETTVAGLERIRAAHEGDHDGAISIISEDGAPLAGPHAASSSTSAFNGGAQGAPRAGAMNGQRAGAVAAPGRQTGVQMV